MSYITTTEYTQKVEWQHITIVAKFREERQHFSSF